MVTNEKKYTILLLSAPIGSGHKLAAQALEQSFEEYENIEVVHGSIFDFFPERLGKWFLNFYLWVLSHCPWMYELAYKWGNKESSSFWLRNSINKILASLATDFIKNVNPDAVVATHATPAGIMSIYKSKYNKKIFLAAVVTDFTVHKWWLCDGIDVYFSASEEIKEQFNSTNSAVLATGIPLRKQFYEKLNRNALRAKFNWHEDDIICLLMGGGEGLLPMKSILEAFKGKIPDKLKIVAITGHNEKLQHILESFTDFPLTVYGFTEAVPELLLAADVVVTKAGGLTAAETLVAGCDYIIYKPLPGQETGNAIYLKKFCNVFVAHSPHDVKNFVCNHVDLPLDLRNEERSKRSSLYGKADAAKVISQYIIEKIKS